MALELLEEIRKAEQAADLVRAEAQNEARSIIKSAEEDCLRMERTAAVEARTAYQRILAEKRKTVEADIAARAAGKLAARSAMCVRAKARLETVAHAVLEKVVQHGDR